MRYQLPFESADNPRWKLLDAARERLMAARSQDAVIAIVRDTARNVTSADGVTFVLRENTHCHYVEEDAIAPLWKGQRFPMTSCISGWAMLNRKTAVIPDIFADDRIPHDVYRKTFVKSLVMTPVGLDTPLAAIGAYWRDKPIISPREVAAVESIAAMVAEAIGRVRATAA
ncbi:MAG TPA: GAF domain-containing protein [Rhizomicrobium sp.]|jgi:GAF domain-containing protein|nr:GAF domain-containing protein [Rhizomicrobium sp.]